MALSAWVPALWPALAGSYSGHCLTKKPFLDCVMTALCGQSWEQGQQGDDSWGSRSLLWGLAPFLPFGSGFYGVLKTLSWTVGSTGEDMLGDCRCETFAVYKKRPWPRVQAGGLSARGAYAETERSCDCGCGSRVGILCWGCFGPLGVLCALRSASVPLGQGGCDSRAQVRWLELLWKDSGPELYLEA